MGSQQWALQHRAGMRDLRGVREQVVGDVLVQDLDLRGGGPASAPPQLSGTH
jgi:hypothetical protein